jgi:hypothetical protein
MRQRHEAFQAELGARYLELRAHLTHRLDMAHAEALSYLEKLRDEKPDQGDDE